MDLGLKVKNSGKIQNVSLWGIGICFILKKVSNIPKVNNIHPCCYKHKM